MQTILVQASTHSFITRPNNLPLFFQAVFKITIPWMIHSFKYHCPVISDFRSPNEVYIMLQLSNCGKRPKIAKSHWLFWIGLKRLEASWKAG